ncbi:hypothetical protein RB614_01000 [Phytohabitans sp. ZYX-F-186]|uniref:Pecanex-like protein 1 n=1 Tax=Phytohabitans maris TaxID=3071409 RepID=A0ABU0Z9L3_9ACTN|nr:hypothetical protein [Phytohabitans sp. ZYX-F-186]MDQ7903096.1 hypothetical protein [Phytohabitans sp. ZYX-F-186]
MYRSVRRRKGLLSTRRNRVIAIIGTLAVFGGGITVTQVSSAHTNRRPTANRPPACAPAPGGTAPAGQGVTTTRQNGRTVRNYWGDGQDCGTQAAAQTVSCPDVEQRLPEIPARARDEVARNLDLLQQQIAEANRRLATSQGQGGANFVQNVILGPLADKRRATLDRITIAIDRAGPRPQGLRELATCTVTSTGGGNSTGAPNQPATGAPTTAPPPLDFGPDECSEGNGLDIHDGFQNGNRCVDTEMGEVANADQNPTLLIVSAPQSVRVNQPFTIRVSTRNLIRDRFLPAGQGGYYVDMSILNDQNLVRGHFHSACRQLDSTRVAPDPAPVPAFFVATEDNGGGAAPDVIEIRVPGLANRGIFQCASWAGDASHRIPMMQRANQIPAFDAVRVIVR